MPFGRDASAFGARRVRICAERRSHLGETLLCTGRGTIERRTALADKFGARFGGDYFVIKGKGRNPFWGFLPLCYWCVVIVCTI